MLDMLVFGCVVFPFLAALYLWLCPAALARKSLPPVMGVIALCAVGLALSVRKGGADLENYAVTAICGVNVSPLIAFLDFVLLFVILYLAWRNRHTLATLLVAAQIVGLAAFDLVIMRNAPAAPTLLRFDSLSLVMVSVISLVGGVICCYALGYMKEHEEHLHLASSRQPRFYAVLTLFLGAMNGLVLADNLGWVYFFWEITTLCSFLLIGHDKTAEAIQNALRALWMNMVGGVAFLLALIMLQGKFATLSIQALTGEAVSSVAFLLPMALLCIGGFTKSALTPFQSWLCGAMVAPTPVSALLHSSTMVKAGVYLLLRLSPMIADTALGIGVAVFGAFTFFAASALAVGQSNAKRVLAYSTIANLGLIASCAGMGTEMAISAGILCIIFHAISKGLLFLCVGSIEQRIGSRDIEDMRGLARRMPTTANITVLGIMTMMLPPFGMLLCKWMAMEAATAVPGGTVLLILLLALGSALTVLFWARFAGTMLGHGGQGGRPPAERQDCAIICSLRILAGAAIVFSLLSPFLYQAVVGAPADPAVAPPRFFAAGWLPLTVYPLFVILGFGWWLAARAARRHEDQPMALPYLAGLQAVKDGETGFVGPMNAFVAPSASNYYMSNIFGEEKIEPLANIVALTMLVLLLGGMLL